MRAFDIRTTVAAFELEQMVVDFWLDIDGNGGRNATAFFTEDCEGRLGPESFKGHEGVRGYYAARLERIARQQNGGIRTSRHAVSNLRIEFEDSDHAKLSFIILAFAGSGAPPLLDATVPVSISDAHFLCRHSVGTGWRVHRFLGDLVLMGSDDFVKNSVRAAGAQG